MKDKIFFELRESVCDWNGKLLNSAIRDAITINNIVRVCIKHDSGYFEGIYIQVTAVEDSDLIGIVQDTYRQFFEGEIIYVDNGELIRFPRASIIEVPLSWDGNENLRDATDS